MWRWAVVLGLVQVAVMGQQTIPFVGCVTDGQLGLIRAPKGKAVRIDAPREMASKLAYYASNGLAVLAPRGWFCRASLGSSGEVLFVSPAKLTHFPDASMETLISLELTEGGSSGRTQVAEMIARVFRSHMEFANAVNELFPFELPAGPFPDDTLVRRSDTVVEFKTPAGVEGLGSRFWIGKTTPIEGVAILRGDKYPNLFLLSVKVPANLSVLTPVILQHLEKHVTDLGPR